ncbi:MAG: relaxase/mobilization nuclease domain-containing protein [Treponema sp.]|uniref:relaxase/mobilization nuclease domain-containing protein n=1 Tax=Treponema sp. TaxID=166 RepID=UPI00298EAD04|nr:relaxase/mobilization nuclease domain-containing protein [Treponema sp.]MCQ2601281.1 relaxase/mobilization nuclease domain-containing protein [Treponema sp.]
MEISKEDYEFLTLKPPKGKTHKELDAGRETERLLRELSKLFTSPQLKRKKKDKKIHFSGRLSNNYSQRCVVKMTYGNTKEAHMKFFCSYMIQENKDEVKEKPKYFDAIFDEVPEVEIEKYKSEMTDMYFKFILSPELKDVPLKVLARQFIKNLQLQTGFSFSWKAVIHNNTDHPHCHILINGKDRKTKKKITRIPPRIIRNAHLSAEQICTNLVGPVTSKELEVRRDKSFTARRWTNHDDDLFKCITRKNYTSETGTEYTGYINPINDGMEKRLKALVDIGLAISFPQSNPPVYYLEKDWDIKLRSIGRYNSFLQARSNLLFSTPGMLQQYTPEDGKIQGLVTKVYLMDDESIWNNAIVVENNKTKKAFYIPLRNPPSENLYQQFVTVDCKKNQSGKLSPQIKVMDSSKIRKKSEKQVSYYEERTKEN